MASFQRQEQIKVKLRHENRSHPSCMINFVCVASTVGVFEDKTMFIPFTVSP